VHGPAPELAGKGIAKPTACVLSGAMMVRHLGKLEEAARVERAVDQVLAKGAVRTPDLGGTATTGQYTDALIQALGAA